MSKPLPINSLVVFKHEPSLGVWRLRHYTLNDMIVGIVPHQDVPDGVCALSKVCASINVSVSALKRYQLLGEPIHGL